MYPILILAAGTSSRMRGRDKLLEPIDGTPMLSHIAEQAAGTGAPVFAVLPGPNHVRYEILKGTKVICFDVPDSKEGVGGTLRGGVKRLPPCDAFMIVLADLPELRTADFAAVSAARKTSPDKLVWRGATQDGKPGHPILFDGSLRPRFEELSGDSGGSPLLQSLKDQTCLVRLPGDHARLDLDTPEEWQAWREARQG